MNTSRISPRAGGWSLIAAAVGFIAAFSYLAAQFNYPTVLDGPAADVLPRLLELGNMGRAIWVAYALIPLLLIPAAIGASNALRTASPNHMRVALVLAVVAAISMLTGLARWPTIHWQLAQSYVGGAVDARTRIAPVFDALNLYLGNIIGEFIGEVALNGFFVLTGMALLRIHNRVAGITGILAGVIGLIASLRNVTDAVATVASLDNYVLPLWLIGLGVILVRSHSHTLPELDK